MTSAFISQKIFPRRETIRVEKEGEERLLSIVQFETLMGIAFIPWLDFSPVSAFRDIVEKIRKLHKRGELDREQLWWGSYYKEELSSLFLPKVVIRWIDDAVGWGVFTEKDFKKMEFIAEYCGKVRKRTRADKKNAYCFEYVAAPHASTSYRIDAQEQGGIGRFINHSSKHPNLHVLLATVNWINHVIFIAKEPIPKGTQLLYDYGADYWSSRPKPKDLDPIQKAE